MLISSPIILVAGDTSPYCLMNVCKARLRCANATSSHFAYCLSVTFVGSFAIVFPLISLVESIIALLFFMAFLRSIVNYYLVVKRVFLL